MEFEQLVCYSQSIIILIFVIGFFINFKNNKAKVIVKSDVQCSSCGKTLLGQDSNYCSYCGHMNSHSKGTHLEK